MVSLPLLRWRNSASSTASDGLPMRRTLITTPTQHPLDRSYTPGGCSLEYGNLSRKLDQPSPPSKVTERTSISRRRKRPTIGSLLLNSPLASLRLSLQRYGVRMRRARLLSGRMGGSASRNATLDRTRMQPQIGWISLPDSWDGIVHSPYLGSMQVRQWLIMLNGSTGEDMECGVPNTFSIKDSGERQEFSGGMVRDVTTGKTDYSLALDGPMFDRIAEHLTKGAIKYEKRNWMKASGQVEYDRFKESALRHFLQWYRGETDEDHAAAVYFNINGAEYVKERLGE